MEKVKLYFGDDKFGTKNYAYKLLMFLEENDFNCLPNYPFEYSLDEMILCEDEELEKKVQEYCYWCLTNLEAVIKENL